MKEGGRRRDGTTISTSPTDLDGQLKTVATANEIASSSIEKESETRKEGRYNCTPVSRAFGIWETVATLAPVSPTFDSGKRWLP
ncbi:hypothetical protein F2Q70_00001289 [Brassica cretica]|uniref:Uncharacterized protein n=1 Tax=Brassica cretica TaxID=69181 RepID=A0A8S9IT34_BRACR|nr:hypothetical protein F2Q70_00001289 [Brassica cretica]